MELELRGKDVLVAGGSRGIGLAIARGFAIEGARVAIAARTESDLDAARVELEQLTGPGRVLAVTGDLRRPHDAARVVERAAAAWDGLDVLVSVVGSGSGRRGWDLSEEDWREGLDSNLVGPMLLASAALPHLGARAGAVVFVSSIAGRQALDAPVPYGAAKSALEAAMKSLSRLAGVDGVRVNAVAPGNVLFPGGGWARRLAEQQEVVERYIEQEVPLRRFATPEEVADAVLFLSSVRASFVTGATLVVDGGQTTAFS